MGAFHSDDNLKIFASVCFNRVQLHCYGPLTTTTRIFTNISTFLMIVRFHLSGEAAIPNDAGFSKKLAQVKLWLSQCIFNCSNDVKHSNLIVCANILYCINNIGPCYFTVAPM